MSLIRPSHPLGLLLKGAQLQKGLQLMEGFVGQDDKFMNLLVHLVVERACCVHCVPALMYKRESWNKLHGDFR